MSKALWRFLLCFCQSPFFLEEARKRPSINPSLLLTLTFLFIPRSGEGERDGVVESASMVGFFFFKAREEESSRPLIASSSKFFIFNASSLFFCVFFFYFSPLLLFASDTIANSSFLSPRLLPSAFCLSPAAAGAENEGRSSRVTGVPPPAKIRNGRRKS